MPTTYCPGDTVNCKVNFGKLAWANDKEYERIATLYIITICDSGYLTLVPSDLFLVNSFKINKMDCKEFEIDEKFIGGEAHFINDNHVVSVHKRLSGLHCMKCREYFEYAEVNRLDENGKGSLLCWSCRTYQYR